MLACALVVPAAAHAQEKVKIVTSPDRHAPRLDREELLAIFLMRVRTWPDGTPLHVFVLPGNSELHYRFTRELLGTYPYVLNRAWNQLVFTGTGLAPEMVQSIDEMREKVRSTPGAIGYLPVSPQSGADSTRIALWP